MADELYEKFGVTKKSGEIIFCENEPGTTLFFIQTGHVRLSKIVSTKEKTLAIIGPGDIFGEMAILEQMPRSATAVAEGDVKMLEMDKTSFSQLVNAQPGIALKLLRLFASRIYDQKRKLRIMYLPDNDSKVLDVLLMLAERRGIEAETSREVEFETDAEEIANWAGISTKDCENTLHNLEKGARLQVFDRLIKVGNLYQILRFVQSKRKSLDREK